ncbi:thiamine transport system substrate-binding protein [Arcanobacterium wilhelmae]|uniref:Thiamine transport system substrate-binding protein n=1 Tax=Arcanobacterium wilhelmae TaxID=1803177 RepID=A0ABT9N8W3_9ACTO|nr:thiamine ABC transporter substrate-binding protein [Arcanobacterium wilhelmae]MDP9800141.1 thiamine transport system substrate-binding protein [Arcanobacterium wilhelmae]WFN89581.1 thiamine ABC transporter substrate-binding protein [Arcanobacterium wilhelmae]
MKFVKFAAVAAASALVLGACGTSSSTSGSSASSSAAAEKITDVKVVTNGSWKLKDETLAKFTKETGYKVTLVNGEESGTLDSKLILTKANPVGDAVVGLTANNVLQVGEAGVFDKESAPKPATGAEKYAVAGAEGAVALDRSDACFNYDIAWFKEKNLTPPAGLEDLIKPEYKGLTVIQDPSKSDTGFALLTATIVKFGEDGYTDYWTKLMGNGTKVDASWTDAYQVDFTAGEGKGKYPIVMSYASSPFWTINEAGDASATANVAGGCYPVVEYGAVLTGAKNAAGAKAFLEWLATPQAQAANAEENVTYPIDESVELPKGMAEFAPRPNSGDPLDPTLIKANKQKWITAVTALF